MKITLLISTIYIVIGNMVGYGIYRGEINSDGFLSFLFIPYTLTWSLSSLAGADSLTLVFILIAFLISLAVFFPIGLYLEKPAKNNDR